MLVTAVMVMAGCSNQKFVDEALYDGARLSTENEFANLIEKARWGDGQAFLKLADCYRDGKGVEKDFVGMFSMVILADRTGSHKSIENYLKSMPEDSEYRIILEAMNHIEKDRVEEAQSLAEQLITRGSSDGYTIQGVTVIESGDTLGGRSLLEKAAVQGSNLASLILCMPDWRENQTTDVEKLKALTEKMPYVNMILARIYAGLTDEQLAIHYLLKADKHACLNKRGAKWLLKYQQNVGGLPLSEKDIQRLQILAGKKAAE